MDETLLKHMIRNCFYQYHYTKETLPLSPADYEQLLTRIKLLQKEQPQSDLYEIIEDIVYEFITTT